MSGFLVDTNIFSEFAKPDPNPKIDAWFSKNVDTLYISTVTLGEIHYGISILPEGRRRIALNHWRISLSKTMEARTLSFNRSVAFVWADMRASLRTQGITLPMADGMIAATAKRHELVVATRNLSDFKLSGVKCFDPSV